MKALRDRVGGGKLLCDSVFAVPHCVVLWMLLTGCLFNCLQSVLF